MCTFNESTSTKWGQALRDETKTAARETNIQQARQSIWQNYFLSFYLCRCLTERHPLGKTAKNY